MDDGNFLPVISCIYLLFELTLCDSSTRRDEKVMEYLGFQMLDGKQCHGASVRVLRVYPLVLDSTTRISTVNVHTSLSHLYYKPFQFEYAWHILLILQYENILASIDYFTCYVDDCLKWLRHVSRLMLSLLPSMATLLPTAVWLCHWHRCLFFSCFWQCDVFIIMMFFTGFPGWLIFNMFWRGFFECWFHYFLISFSLGFQKRLPVMLCVYWFFELMVCDTATRRDETELLTYYPIVAAVNFCLFLFCV